MVPDPGELHCGHAVESSESITVTRAPRLGSIDLVDIWTPLGMFGLIDIMQGFRVEYATRATVVSPLILGTIRTPGQVSGVEARDELNSTCIPSLHISRVIAACN